MMHALYIRKYTKGTSWDCYLAVSAVIWLHPSEGIRQAVSQSEENSIQYNLLETFRAELKTLLGLVRRNQYCQGSRMVL